MTIFIRSGSYIRYYYYMIIIMCIMLVGYTLSTETWVTVGREAWVELYYPCMTLEFRYPTDNTKLSYR